MKILICDGVNLGDAFAQILSQEGHDVYATTDNYGTLRWARPLPFDLDSPEVKTGNWDLIVCPGTWMSAAGWVDKFRDAGFPVIGAGQEGFQLEEKQIGRKVFDEAGLRSPAWGTFENCTSAVTALRSGRFGERIVVKFTETNRPFRTTVCRSLDDACHILETMAGGQVVLEEYVEGMEIGVMGYFDGERFITGTTKFEHKWLSDGDLGVLTPEMGSVVFYDPHEKWQGLFDAILTSPAARKHLASYRGLIDLALIVDSGGNMIPLEFTCRGGIPETDIMMTLLRNPHTRYAEFLLSVANGKTNESLLHYDRKVAIGVNLVVCGFPWNLEGPVVDSNGIPVGNLGSPISGIEKVKCQTTMRGVAGRNGRLVTTLGWVLCVADTGDSVREASDNVYRNVSHIAFQDMVYRTDIGATAWLNAEFWTKHGYVSKGIL